MNDRTIGNLIGAIIVAILCWAIWAWQNSRGGFFYDYSAENHSYAADFFDGLVPYDRIVASQRWHPRGAEAWDCTYAVVALSAESPAEPIYRDRSDKGWQFAWGGDWATTPAQPLGDTTRDAISFCAKRLPDGVGLELQSVLETEGSFYVRDSVGETVFIYSTKERIAARIRFGD